jgi:fatty acid desaturase
MFFLAALRLNHEAIPRNLGFTKRGHSIVMHALSAIMLASNHSVAFNHRRHHAHIGTEHDLEGKAGDMSRWQVLCYGPIFPIECHTASLREGSAETRRAVRIDLALNLVLPVGALILGSTALAYHVAVMIVAQCFTALFAVWITHHGCNRSALVARSQRSRIINFLSYNMFFHLEHHMFPAVPVSRLPILAQRMDKAAPEVAAKIRPVIGW